MTWVGTNFSARKGGAWQMAADGADRLLSTGQVAVMFGVNPRTVNLWASESTGIGRDAWWPP